MKRIFLILPILLMIAGFASAADVHSYTAIKVGYGNETGGAGIGIENKYHFFGFTGGIGYFNDKICWNFGFKGYLDLGEVATVYGGLNFGILGYEWSSLDNVYKYIYGPYFMIGAAFVGKNGFYADIGGGYGGSKTEYFGKLEFPTVQLSVGYAFN